MIQKLPSAKKAIIDGARALNVDQNRLCLLAGLFFDSLSFSSQYKGNMPFNPIYICSNVNFPIKKSTLTN